jgi:uridylate kinase
MKEKVIVISLGGSVIVPENPNFKLLDSFKKVIKRYSKNHKFVIVAGGGSIARTYIKALELEHKSKYELSVAGIRATRMNAIFLMQLFGKDANKNLPLNMEEVANDLEKHNIVICGALRFAQNSTSDSTAAKLAHFLKGEFINITNVPGLYTADPRKDKTAKLISKISWKSFNNIVKKIRFHAGQHFVLDQHASDIIKQNKIPTFIISSPASLNNILKGNKFKGTLISG